MRRFFLYVLIVSVVISALLGIVALLGSGRLRDTDWKILGSTLCVAGASILSMACSVSVERGRLQALAWTGVATAVLGFALVLLGLWIEPDDETYWRSAATLLVVAVFCAHASLLMLARPPARQRWLPPATLLATGLLGLLLLYPIWDEGHDKHVWRAVGVLAILGTAGTILSAVFQRLGRTAAARGAGAAAGDAPPCPHCGKPIPRELIS